MYTGCVEKADRGKLGSGSMSFTIISGSLKGRTITAPDLGITRPPLSRIRKSIMDFLTPYLHDSRYLDLFSGTGSYLFEAVSRGASRATGVEIDVHLAESINRQAKEFNVDRRLECLNDDVFAAVPKLHSQVVRFDIIMIAPPQYRGYIDKTLRTLEGYPVSAEDGLILLQHDTSETDTINMGSFLIDQRRKYGNTTFTVLRPPVSSSLK